MEPLQETYEAGGFVFRTKKEAELAQREIEGTKYLRQKLDMENPNAVFSIYQNLIEQDLFETPVGYCFLKELRDYLLMIPAISNEEVLAIPIRYPQTEEEEKKQKKEQKKEEQRKERQREKEKAKNKKEQKNSIDKALKELPEKQKEVIILKYYEGLKIKDISKILDEKVPTIKSRLKQGIRKQRE